MLSNSPMGSPFVECGPSIMPGTRSLREASRIGWHTCGVPLPLIVLVGPTATGKSQLAVGLALELASAGHPAEIVNADSMLVYRGMDIGTAKPSAAERRGVPHHLIDILDITEKASVADFQAVARAVIADLRGRGVIPIMVGGSPLYTRAIVDHFDFPGLGRGRPGQVGGRARARSGPFELHRRLAAISPESAAKIEPGNGRRTVRALEVLELTGGHRPVIPEWTYELEDVHQFGLNLERAELDAPDRPAGRRHVGTRVWSTRCAGLLDTGCGRA